MGITEKQSYVVGYGKPPKEHRFKPGDRANPRGRGKAPELNLAAVFTGLLNEYVALTNGAPKVSKQEAFVRSIIRDSLRCQPRAFRTFVKLAKRAKLFEIPRDPMVEGGNLHVDIMSAADLVELRAQMAAEKAEASNSPASKTEHEISSNERNPGKTR
jgi:hypothetical protein